MNGEAERIRERRERLGISKVKHPAAAEPGTVEFEVSGDFGVRVVVKGPVGDVDTLQRAVAELVRVIRSDQNDDTAR